MLGGIAAWLGFTVPSAAILIALGLYSSSVDLSNAGWVHGLKLAAVAVVALAVVSMARLLTPDWPRRAMAVAALVVALLVSTPLTQVAVIAGGALLGYLFLSAPPASAAVAEPSRIPTRFGVLAIAIFFALLIVLPIAAALSGSSTIGFLQGIYTSAALVFGGGHVVLPLLHATTVDPGWVDQNQFLAGYGATQAMPGPLFTFSAFLGTVAKVPPTGVAGGIVALAVMFLPAFLLIWGTLPFWDRLRSSTSFRRALTGTNAAVVGLLGAALYNPVATNAIFTFADVVIVVVAFAALATQRVPPIVVVVLCAIAAQVVAFT